MGWQRNQKFYGLEGQKLSYNELLFIKIPEWHIYFSIKRCYSEYH